MVIQLSYGHIRQVVFGNDIQDTLLELSSSKFRNYLLQMKDLARFVISVPYHKPDFIEIPL